MVAESWCKGAHGRGSLLLFSPLSETASLPGPGRHRRPRQTLTLLLADVLARDLDTDCGHFRSPVAGTTTKAAELADAGFARLGSGSLEWALENGIVRPTTRIVWS